MRVLCAVLILFSLIGCKQQAAKAQGKYEIEWAGSFYACVDSYEADDGWVRFTVLKNGNQYTIPRQKLDSIKHGCTYTVNVE